MKKILLIFWAFNFIILINNFIGIDKAEANYNQKYFSLSPILKKTMPAVVSIIAEGNFNLTKHYVVKFNNKQHSYDSKSYYFNKTNSKYLLKMQNDEHNDSEFFKILGSGVIINAEKGYIVTNNHVVNDAAKIEVRLSDNRRYYAKLIGQDIQSDIALLQLKNVKHLSVMQLANSDRLNIGDYTIAIGNPYGIGESASYGIISGLGRTGFNDYYNYQNFIQTDAAINHGNSGGALVNLKGELIGINTAIFTPDGSNTRIGFAIPSNVVKVITNQIINDGQVKHITLGVLGSSVDLKMIEDLNLNTKFGIFINRIIPNSVAAKYGMQLGDVITLINNKPIDSLSSINNIIGFLPIGTTIKLHLLRDRKFIDLLVKLDKVDLIILDSAIISDAIEGAGLTNGDSYNNRGVYIDSVIPGSAAANIGLQNGDIISSVNHKTIMNLGDLRRILEKKYSFLAFNIQRNKRKIYLFLNAIN
ncbi:trypsin-like peptidase domain-containing protein [Pantoea sp. SoEX]|uniref:trypsin-like peptidase domain-containing protein n=1 Tax=Pantoea sp. SoEX TaxID=2576763 RepID=UPI00135CE905|nr:trypsin-like peptidase domain-containing protein [Pantoea sp. SoEX]MXP51168.1 PDZ domain-containing protein [Pantoea sp. SoEX]